MSKAPVYIILVNFNGASDCVECLESVLRSDYDDTRVILVDNGSSDGSLQRLIDWARGTATRQPSDGPHGRLTSPPVPKPLQHAVLTTDDLPRRGREIALGRLTFIASEQNLGFAGGNNLALRLLLERQEPGYACLLNSDMVVDAAAVRALVEAANDPTIAAVGGVILDYTEPELVQSVGGGRMSHVSGMAVMAGAGQHRSEVTQPTELGYVSGGLLLMPLARMRDVGLMDETYFLYAEDADWGERMRYRGLRLACALDAFVWHKGSQTTGARSPLQDYYIVRSSLMFVSKHAPLHVPLAAIHSIARFLAPKLLRGEWLRARAVLRAFASYLRADNARYEPG